MQKTMVGSLGQEDPLEEKLATQTAVFLPGQWTGSLVAYNASHKALGTAEQAHNVSTLTKMAMLAMLLTPRKLTKNCLCRLNDSIICLSR